MFTRVFPIRWLPVCAFVVGVCAAVCLPLAAKTPASFSTEAWSDVDRGDLEPDVLELALGAVACAVKDRKSVV